MDSLYKVYLVYEDGPNAVDSAYSDVFKGEYMSSLPVVGKNFSTLYIGLGKQDKFDKALIKPIFGKTAKKLKKLKAGSAEIEIGHMIDKFGQNAMWDIVQGLKLGSYAFDDYKQKKEISSTKFSYTIEGKHIDDKLKDIVSASKHMAAGINYARDLVNIPANRLTPEIMADKVTELFKGSKVEVTVLDEKQCKKLGMDMFLTVGNSSAFPPRLIIMRYLADKENSEVYGYVGKGITYDTGGYSLKPSASMLGMKTDMAGAAAVIGAIYSLSKNNIKTNVIGVLPCCENRLSNSSCVPGDVINSMNGKTIEVTNTDAEGRLILADSVTYAIRKENVTKIVDIATLTGAVVAALGHHTAGILTNNKTFLKEFKKASKIAREKYWQFPIDDMYRKNIKSDIADIKNSSVKYAGTITGACFIEEFVENKPWIHVDIAGTSYVDAPPYEYQVKGATGAGTATLYAMACGYKK